MKICPKCGQVISYSSYFNAFICHNCGSLFKPTFSRVKIIHVESRSQCIKKHESMKALK